MGIGVTCYQVRCGRRQAASKESTCEQYESEPLVPLDLNKCVD